MGWRPAGSPAKSRANRSCAIRRSARMPSMSPASSVVVACGSWPDVESGRPTRLRTTIRRVAKGADEERHVMMGLAVEDFEGHGDVWMEGRRAALLKVGAGREPQPIETRRRRTRLGHQRAQPAIAIRRSLPHELPAVARRIPLERDLDACGRHAAGNVENVG